MVSTGRCVLRWYRPLELYFKARHYGPAVDMWAVGCIFGEIMLRTPMFPGQSEMEVMKRIIQTLGTPSEENWAVSEMGGDACQAMML